MYGGAARLVYREVGAPGGKGTNPRCGESRDLGGGDSQPSFSGRVFVRSRREPSVDNEVGVLHHPVELAISDDKVRSSFQPTEAVGRQHYPFAVGKSFRF